MINRSLKVLEYDKIIELLAARAESQLGKKRCLALRPKSSIRKIQGLQEETKEALALIGEVGKPPLFGIYDLSDQLSYAQKDGVLSAGSLLKLSASLRVCQALKDYLDQEEITADLPIIEDMVDRLSPIKNLSQEIDRVIVDEEEIADDASSKLFNIRKSISIKNEAVRSKISSIINSNSNKLQDNIATMRDGRHVVAVRAKYKNSFPGIIHDKSSSGQTVYIEPQVIVDLNNEISLLELEEKEEIERILRKLSSRVGRKAVEIKANTNILEDLDCIFARGKLAEDMTASYPQLNDKGYIKLVDARHPLLGEKVVPISVELGKDFTSLLITGPNTGGKTVSLKTVGLLTLMAQSGLHIPANPGSQIACFNHVYADIGDEQSIEQSLSTFSSHMTNIQKILKRADKNSLVLFDELGAGTDPTEGSALAIAIMDFCLKKEIRTIATTHYAELKIYALNTEGVENASVEFDLDSLSPTYKLELGSVGKSNAFDISRKLGLSEDIISYADSLISSENRSFEDALDRIEKDKDLIEKLKVDIARKEADIEKIQKRKQAELDEVKRQKDSLIEEARKEAKEILVKASQEAEESIKELNQIKKDGASSDLARAHEIKRQLKESEDKQDTRSYDFLNQDSGLKSGDIKLGDEVEVLSMGQRGQVIEISDDGEDLVVEMGILKINTQLNQVRKVEGQEDKKSQVKMGNLIKSKMAQDVKTEIDLRGKNIEEAREELETYLDDAYLSGLKEVRIIHGKGTGVLRKGVQDYLNRHKMVESYRLGKYGEGDLGVTIVKLKE